MAVGGGKIIDFIKGPFLAIVFRNGASYNRAKMFFFLKIHLEPQLYS